MSAASDLANHHPDKELMTEFLFTTAEEPEGRGSVLLSLLGSFIHLPHVISNKSTRESKPPCVAGTELIVIIIM